MLLCVSLSAHPTQINQSIKEFKLDIDIQLESKKRTYSYILTKNFGYSSLLTMIKLRNLNVLDTFTSGR